jgi:hypothetical protein
MATEGLEKRLKDVEKKIKALEHENERLQAVNEIQNLMSRVQHSHTANRHGDMEGFFAKKAPGIRLYFGDMGYWEGVDAPKKASATFDGMSTVGMMAVHLLANPVIVVAGDGKTAKGVWMASGMVAMNNPKTGPTAGWEWNRYGIDFIKEDGKWKFWHYHVFPLFNCSWNEDWAEHFKKPPMAMDLPPEKKPPFPPTAGDYSYTPDIEMTFVPVPPQPYETFDPKNIY